MPGTPKASLLVGFSAAHNGGSRKDGFSCGDRWVEKKAIQKIENESGKRRRDLELCEVHVLPAGVFCEMRVERRGFMFCGGNDEGCPLVKRV